MFVWRDATKTSLHCNEESGQHLFQIYCTCFNLLQASDISPCLSKPTLKCSTDGLQSLVSSPFHIMASKPWAASGQRTASYFLPSLLVSIKSPHLAFHSSLSLFILFMPPFDECSWCFADSLIVAASPVSSILFPSCCLMVSVYRTSLHTKLPDVTSGAGISRTLARP